MISRSLATQISPAEDGRRGVARLLAEGGDERIALDPLTGRNAYGCGGEVWTGGLTFSSTTASPLSPEGLAIASAWVSRLAADASPGERLEAAAVDVRRSLTALCGLAGEPHALADVVLAPSGTDLHHIAAACARADRRGPLVTIMPDPAESGRGVERAVRGIPYSASPPFGRRGSDIPAPQAGEVVPIAVRAEAGAPRPADDIDSDVEAACRRAAQGGGAMLLVLLDASKTGLVAPTAACAERLKAQYGERLTVLVDACQFRLRPADIRAHLRRGFLVVVTGSKFLGGPPFAGALLIPGEASERLRQAALPWRDLVCSAREDWPETYAGRSLLPRAFSLGPALRWAPALETLATLEASPPGATERLAEAFGAAFAVRVGAASGAFEALPSGPAGPPRAGATIFPLLLKRGGRVLGAEAVGSIYLRLRDLAHRRNAGHLWIGQPVTVGHDEDGPVSAVRLALSAPQLIAGARDPDGCGRLMAQADECLWEMARMIDEAPAGR